MTANRLGLILLAFVFFATLISSGAKERRLVLYVYGQPFEGSVIVVGHEIYAEAGPFADALDFAADSYKFPSKLTRNISGRTYVSLIGYAKMAGALVNINWSTKIVDFYTPQRLASSGPLIILPPEAVSPAAAPSLPMPSYGNPAQNPGASAQSAGSTAEGLRMSPPIVPGGYPYYFYQFYPYSPYPYLPYSYFAYSIPLPIRVPSNVHFSNGVLPEDDQGHVAPMNTWNSPADVHWSNGVLPEDSQGHVVSPNR